MYTYKPTHAYISRMQYLGEKEMLSFVGNIFYSVILIYLIQTFLFKWTEHIDLNFDL